MSRHVPNCPNIHCLNRTFIKRDGTYFRKNDSRKVQRFKCTSCGKKFSRATFELECGQKKRRVNFPLLKLLCSGVSQRRAALLLNINKNTVARKFDYLAKKYALKNQLWLEKVPDCSLTHLQFDDLITTEHTKLKPLTVTAIVNAKTREILAIEQGRIRAFGHLADLSRKKYGKRDNEHPKVLRKVFKKVQKKIHPCALLESDEHQTYGRVLRDYLPSVEHRAHKGGRGCVTGQGELKRQHYDPLFCINQTYAMLRANINRLIRKTWCTTKVPQKLQQHLELYMWFHNNVLISK